MKLAPLLSLTALCVLPPAHAADEKPDDKFSPETAEFVKRFKGKGAMDDGSKPLTPAETIAHFKLAPGLKMEVVASEPMISQPLNMNFDERGRLWVVQYLQYPFPAGLKIVKYDEYLRAVFDKVPPAPPNHFKGKDRITILESTKGDGVFDKAKDFVSDLNIARSVVSGRGGVWILNPPYLLFYPDKNRDDVPDGDPKVVLSGFGLEDTHSGANSLAWGPDGWLYGAHGSTCTADVKGVKFLGQAIWRFHPVTEDFEVFAEGGGNTFSLEFDAKGRAFSGTNFGKTRGMFYPQGSAGIKGWGKHGPLMNPYSFGWFEHMEHKGYEPRFTQTMCIYEGGAIPQLEGFLISPMSLMNRVMAAKMSRDTSTYRTEDIDPLVLTDDRWFRPVDTKVGPDGAIYLADWYDSRLTHVDPRDTWDHDHGRVYRLEAENAQPAVQPFDLAALPNDALIEVLKNPNKWYRQTAIRIFHDRHDATIAPKLLQLVRENTGQFALECFWALNASGGFTDEVALGMLEHQDEFVRYWAVRLLGDRYPPARYSSSTAKPKPLPAELEKKLVLLARKEAEAQVRVQIASSAKRLPGENALPILREQMFRAEDAADKHLPLLEWWALESKAASDRAAVLDLLKDSSLWRAPIFSNFIVTRLGQRFTAERTGDGLEACARLLALAPTSEDRLKVAEGMDAGLQGGESPAIPAALREKFGALWKDAGPVPTMVRLGVRLGDAAALEVAMERVRDAKTKGSERTGLIELLAERREEKAVPIFLAMLRAEKAEPMQVALTNALQRFGSDDIARTFLELAPTLPAKARAGAFAAMCSRASWARLLLAAADAGTVKKEKFTSANLLAIQGLHDAECDVLIAKHWSTLKQSSEAKEMRIAQVRKLLSGANIAKGDAEKGHETFKTMCAVCHTLNKEGGKIGPDLSGYERDNLDFMLPAIMDPSLAIREEFTAFTAVTKDGQTLTGFLDAQTPQSVTMRDLNSQKLVLSRADLKSLTASAMSLMPEGLLDALSEEQMRDLFAYLMKK